MLKKYQFMNFLQCGITEQEIDETLNNAEQSIAPFLGVLSKQERIKILIYVCVFIFMVTIAVLAGYVGSIRKIGNARWFWPVFLMFIYFVGVFISNYVHNRRLSQYYRMAHFVMAVFCRVENNRLYLKHGIELRPGFNGLWLTFKILSGPDLNNYVENARQRFLKPALEHRNKVFGEQVAGDSRLIAEQKKIEAEIKNNHILREANENDIENNEVAEAIADVYNEEYYSNYLGNANDAANTSNLPMLGLNASVSADPNKPNSDSGKKKKRRKSEKLEGVSEPVV